MAKSMRELLNEFVLSLKQADIGNSELLNMEMIVAKQHLFLYTPQLNAKQFNIIDEHLKSGVKVTLVTTKKMDEKVKKNVTQYFFTESKKNARSLKAFNIIGIIFIIIGCLLLGFSVYNHYVFGDIFTRQNNVRRQILPVLVIYLGFLIADYALKKRNMIQPINENLRVSIFKSHKKLPSASIYMTDDKRIIYQPVEDDELGLSHVKVINNPSVVQQLTIISERELPLKKRIGLTNKELRLWLVE